MIQCHFYYTCSAWHNGLSKKLKCRMQCTQNKIIRFMLNAPWRFHVGANEFKQVGLLPIEYRMEQLMLGHMFNIINGNAPAYLISGINMNQHRYSTRARELSCVIPRVKCSGLTSFLYQGVCHWNNLPLEIKQCPSKDTFKYQVKCLLYSRLFVQETSLYVGNSPGLKTKQKYTSKPLASYILSVKPCCFINLTKEDNGISR